MVKVALDAMGGDNAPAEIVRGAVDALILEKELFIYLVGRTADIKAELDACKNEKNRAGFDESRIEIVEAPEVIETGDKPVFAVRHKPDSSMIRALTLVKEKKADAFVSSGSTGAVLVGGQLIVGKLKGVQRTPLAPVIPTLDGAALLVDCGANVDAKPENLIQYAHMGTIYMKYIMGVKDPRVGILNIGVEEEKGNALVKETYPLLREEKGINFVGSVEAADLVAGKADVIVTDAFAGNVALKMYEATGKALLGLMKDGFKANLASKLGAALAIGPLKKKLKKFDASRYGGAPMLGLNGLVVKSHGSAKAVEIKNTMLQCIEFSRQDIPGKIQAALGKEKA